MPQRHLDPNARASPISDACRPRPNDVRSAQGLPAQGRSRLKKLVQCLRLATLNIGTLTGRTRELADALNTRRVDIACMQETKWKGAKARDIGEGYKLYYYGVTNNRNGVAIIISKKLRDNVVEVSRISDRLISIKIDTGSVILRVVSCYAPQIGCTDAEKEEFWHKFDDHLRSITINEHLLVGGDLNGHVGALRDGYEQVHGGQGYGTRNKEGVQILDCAEAHDLVIANTFFKKRDSHLATYTSGGRSTQIDYWLIRRHDFKFVMDAKVIPSETIASQHRL
ncbi:MAG: endonuclease/exonuclease/phosphatase family protein, partial [Aeromonas sp.]